MFIANKLFFSEYVVPHEKKFKLLKLGLAVHFLKMSNVFNEVAVKTWLSSGNTNLNTIYVSLK
jgi:hypothetical protein